MIMLHGVCAGEFSLDLVLLVLVAARVVIDAAGFCMGRRFRTQLSPICRQCYWPKWLVIQKRTPKVQRPMHLLKPRRAQDYGETKRLD